jgi:O-antigen ligase
VGCFLLLALPVLAGPEIQARFFTLENTEADDSANSRRASWGIAWDIATENPIFGVGVRNSNLQMLQRGADREGRTVHNQYLQLAADSGFVGMALFALTQLAALVSLWRCRRFAASCDEPDGRIIGASASGIACSLILFMVGSSFLSLENFELPYLLLLLAAQLAVVSGALNPVNAAVAEAPTFAYQGHVQRNSTVIT